VGKHLSVIESGNATTPTIRRVTKPRPRARVLFLFAFTAAAAFVLVTVVDPYSGATASPYYQSAGGRFAGQATQVVQVNGSYANTIVRETYTVTEKPKPVPVPVPKPVVAASSSTKSSTGSSAAAPTAATASPGSAQEYAAGAVAARGWGQDQYSCLVALWNKESGWRVTAQNGSGAYGIPQALPGSKMASAGPDWATNAGTQIEWGLGYITGRYGTPCGAWAHSVDSGWY
jgi:hypothetical protein